MCDLKGIYQESAALIMRCFRILSIEPRAVGHSVLRLILLRDGNNGGLFGTVLLSVELWSKTGNTSRAAEHSVTDTVSLSASPEDYRCVPCAEGKHRVMRIEFSSYHLQLRGVIWLESAVKEWSSSGLLGLLDAVLTEDMVLRSSFHRWSSAPGSLDLFVDLLYLTFRASEEHPLLPLQDLLTLFGDPRFVVREDGDLFLKEMLWTQKEI